MTIPQPRRTGTNPPVSLTTTVPKEFVHRAAVAEVLLTEWSRTDDTRFTARAQWPRSHSFFTPVGGEYHDPLIATETVRQLGSLLAHAEFDAPLGHQFLMQDCAVTVRPEQLRIGDAPASIDLEICFEEVRLRGRGFAGGRYRVVLRRDGQLAATGVASYTCVGPEVYRRLRGERAFDHTRKLPLTAPTAPQTVGRMSPTDVVLSPIGEPGRWRLRVDTRHPVIFDHPLDHAPGMLLVEAARQAAAATLGCRDFLPVAHEAEFKRYVELDAPCTIEAVRLPGAAPAVLVTGHQFGEPAFTATVTGAPPAR
ncbi:ScbA/BarX family gamma-butyrolactone biosynthesis protein [Kitasatospora cineracea]|uniref:ScbA/BarX family gamma-butyrolactone biosynthesis protein n=1 Tax=Kitasatospora cineracea TaxID=88074 RepID=UPI003441DD9D